MIAHIHELCKIVNGDAHPLSRIMGQIRRMESSDIQQYSRHLITFYMDCMVARCADSPFFAMENLQLRTRLLSVQADEGFLDRHVAVSECQRVLEAIERQPIRWKDVLAGVYDTIMFVAQTLPPNDRSFASALRLVPHLRQWYLFLSFKAAVEDENIVEKINEHLHPQIRVWGIERTIGSFSCYQACDSRWYEYLIPTLAFLPPHPSSWLAKNLERIADGTAERRFHGGDDRLGRHP